MKLTLFLWTCLFSIQAWSFTISAYVFDEENNSPIPNVSVIAPDGKGTATDINGFFELKLEGTEEVELLFKAISYQEHKLKVGPQDQKELKVYLKPASVFLDLVVISGGQFEKRIEEEIMSIDALPMNMLQSIKATELKTAANRIPSLTIIDGQASIRGGSGYSYGVGSRVQLIVDGMPLLSGDFNEIWWSFVPMENIGRLEVVKGASSSLYGSGALNGVLSVETRWPDKKKETNIAFIQGAYFSPRNKNYRWWDKTQTPLLGGIQFSHLEQQGQLDFVVGGAIESNKSYLKSSSEQHARLSTKLRYRPKSNPDLEFSLASNMQYQQQGRFFYWADDTTGTYIPFAGTENYDKYFLVSLDPRVRYIDKHDGVHFFNSRWFHNGRRDDDFYKTSQSDLLFLEYRYLKRGERSVLNVGASNQVQKTFSSLYPDQVLITQNPALYSQYEYKLSRTTLLLGARVEWNKSGADYSEFSKPVLRAGFNHSLSENLHFRLAYGESYRFASVAEKYVEADLNELIGIRPNINLDAEQGRNYEIGLKKSFGSKLVKGYADIAAFVLEYKNLIEYTFGYDSEQNELYFQPQNVGQARISGLELSYLVEVQLKKSKFSLFGGYTFVYPGDLSSDTTQIGLKPYLNNALNSLNSSADLVEKDAILKYRNKHQFKSDLLWERDAFSLGLTFYYFSHIERIDEPFEFIIPGVQTYREANDSGNLYMDARMSLSFTENMKVSFLLNNMSNAEISMRPGVLDAPRSLSVRADWNF